MPKVNDTFFGRADAIAAVHAAVEGSRLVTIAGPAGVGKTRLAQEWVRQLDPGHFGATGFARLDGLADEHSVLGAIAAAVGMPQTGGHPYAAALGDWLRDRDVLLVLDNCEHVVAPVAALLEEIFALAPGLTVLATSRRSLGLGAETIVRLDPLSIPEEGASEASLGDSPAVRLFLTRARAQGVDPGTSPAALRGVAALCRGVDGLPLALELAAGWVMAMPVAGIREQLERGLGILRRSGTQESRHATLAGTLSWSHALLAPPARVLLRRLSVFPVSFSLAAAREACVFEGLSDDELLGALRELVESSMVRFAPGSERYHLLNTVRQFARAMLEEAKEEDEADARHAAFARGLALQARAVDFVPEQQWLPRLLPHLEDFHVALRRMQALGRDAEALELAVALTTFWWLAGHHREGIRWLEATAHAGPTVLRAAACFGLGFLGAHDTGDWAAAAAPLDRGIALLEGSGEPGASQVLGYLLCLRGECENMAGRADAGLAFGERGWSLLAPLEDRWGHGFAAWNVGFGRECGGDLAGAGERYEAVVASQRGGSQLVLMIGLQSLGRVRERQGDPASAMALYDEALVLWQAVGLVRLGDVHGSRASALLDSARVRVRLGIDPAQAAVLAREAAVLAAELLDDAVAKQAQDLARELAGPVPKQGVFRREGPVWRVGLDGEEALLPDSKGLRQLRHLLQAGGNEVSAAELAQAEGDELLEIGAGQPVLDSVAVAQYRKRLRDLERVLALDDEVLDAARRRAAADEHDSISRRLAAAFGLRGQVRRMGSPLERMRVNVTRTLRAAVAEVQSHAPALGQQLQQALRTGSYCSLRPAIAVRWQF